MHTNQWTCQSLYFYLLSLSPLSLCILLAAVAFIVTSFRTPNSAISASWSVWSSWTAWSTSCGDGLASRARTCTYPLGTDSQCQGVFCPGSSLSMRSRHAYNASDGAWSPWSSWSSWAPSAVQCGSLHYHNRTRTCTNPAPSCGGADCVGVRLDNTTKHCELFVWERKEKVAVQACCMSTSSE